MAKSPRKSGTPVAGKAKKTTSGTRKMSERESGKTLRESRKTFKESGKTLKESGKTLKESGKTLKESGKTLKEFSRMSGKKLGSGKKPIKASVSQKSNPMSYTPKVGGKSLNYDFFQKRKRRLSLASTSSDSSDGLAGNSNDASNLPPTDSDSESSLTAMSEQDETAASRRGSVFFKTPASAKSSKSSKATRTARKSVAGKLAGKGKSIYETANQYRPDDDSDNHVQFFANDSDNHVQFFANDSDASADHGIYSIAADEFEASSMDESEVSGDESEMEDSQNDSSSSSDDEAIDFVQLQSERRRPVPPTKSLAKPKPSSDPHKEKKKMSLMYRRRSSVAIPEDINFKFEFDDAASDSGGDVPMDDKTSEQIKHEEEDLGEELVGASESAPMEFHFDQPLVEVPKFKDEELISDDDYEYDDNDLLATLQADNDLDEFINVAKPAAIKTRQSSMSSLNEEDGEDAFLKEEEKYLVNEFETNGFDEDDLNPTRLETARIMNSFNELDEHSANQNGKVLQYATSDSDGFSDNDNDDKYYDGEEDDGDEYVDFIDFDKPFSKDHRSSDQTQVLPIQSKENTKKPRKLQAPKQKSKKRRAHDSDDEDDSYLWNYFFSSDAESSGESDADHYDADEQLVLEEIFRQNLEQRKKEMERESSMEPAESRNEQDYEAGESTDEDESLPSAGTGSAVGSKVAKEVLSSKTADYRPPVLGIWAAVDSKPFGIIDGLSTRTLNHQGSGKAKPKGWRNFSFNNSSEDSAIELDELLNISELDNDDENDVRIWRDFNNNKKHIPLGAFRNKTHISSLPIVVAEPMAGYSGSKLNGNYNGKRRYSSSQQLKAKLANKSSQAATSAASGSLSKDLNLPSKSKLRRASIADAVSEGYRSTKAGLYSENVLADVEEILGEDRDLMALIKGL